jgi:hypothetical protein
MQTLDLELDDDCSNLPKGVEMADWKEDPEAVLRIVDEQLKEFGLEVVMYDMHSDTYCWKIQRRA